MVREALRRPNTETARLTFVSTTRTTLKKDGGGLRMDFAGFLI
jgi:hypothetical protein